MSLLKPKGTRQLSPTDNPSAWARAYLTSTVGTKVLVALTGLALIGFLVFHMLGNLKVLFGRDSINAYAYFLKHSLGPFLWIARAGLLGVFVLHVYLAVKLHAKSAAARPVPYMHQRTTQASLASRTMLLSGLVVGAFTVFHLAHYTFGWAHEVQRPDGTWANYLDLTETTPDGTVRHDVYSMVVAGFSTPWISLLYIASQAILYAHLSHGIQSTIQTLGLKSARFAPAWVWLGHATAALVVGGNIAIVAAVWGGIVKPVYAVTR